MANVSHQRSGQISVYPGRFVLLHKPRRRFFIKDKYMPDPHDVLPVLMKDLPDYYRIEMEAPGLEPCDFSIFTTDHSMIIIAKGYHSIENRMAGNPDIDHKFTKQEIPLPENADRAFASAEYSNGVLKVSLLKTGNPCKGHFRIVVY